MSGTASGTTGAGTMSGNMNASGSMANNPAGMNNSQGMMNGTASSSSPSDNFTAVNGNKFLMPRLNFYPESGSVIGYTGCNNLLGTVTMEGNTLHFQDALPSTNIQCIGGYDQTAFLDRLRRANSYDISNNQLRLKEGEQVLMVLTKAGK